LQLRPRAADLGLNLSGDPLDPSPRSESVSAAG
jgi:hypothetical protein